MGYFKDYANSRPNVTLPLLGTEKLLVIQNGTLCLISLQAASTPTIPLNTSGGAAEFLLPASGVVRYKKTDNSGNGATIRPSVAGQTVLRQPSIVLKEQDDYITLELIGTDWGRIG